MTPFGRSRQQSEKDAARGAANGDVSAETPAPDAPEPAPRPGFPAPAPSREPLSSESDPGPWGPVGGEPSVRTPPHGTPRPSLPASDAPPPDPFPGRGPEPAAAEPVPERAEPVREPAEPFREPAEPVREPAEPVREPAAPDAAVPPPPERPFRGPLESALRHPFLAIVPVVVLVGVAAAIGLTRDPTYTAEARISVGRVDVPAYTLQGVIIGNGTLASGYSRTIDAEPVVGPAGNAVGLSPSQARDRLSASPIPETTLIRVEADGPNQKDAVKLANAGSRSLINYVEDLNREQESSGLLRQFRVARARAERAKTTLDRLLEDPRPSRAALEKARLNLATAQLESETIGNQYRATQGGPESQDLLQFVAPAAEATSDRRSTFERLLLIGLAAGVLVGLALALLRENSHLIGRKGT